MIKNVVLNTFHDMELERRRYLTYLSEGVFMFWSKELMDLMKELLLPQDLSIEELIEQWLNGTALFGTIIIDTYSSDEAKEIHDALDVVCNRKGYFSFDHYGLYCFWDFYSKEILYIGLTKNLRNRFAQHNGLSGTSSKGNKYKYIMDYFLVNERLGYSVLVQSPYEHRDELLDSKDDEIKKIEGALIEDFKLNNNRLPKWNYIGGSYYGRKPYLVNRYGNISDMLVGKQIGFLNAKSTLRELAQDDIKLSFESDLNIVRGRMYKYGESFEKAISKLMKFNDYFYRTGFLTAGYSNYRLNNLCKSSYLNKELFLEI